MNLSARDVRLLLRELSAARGVQLLPVHDLLPGEKMRLAGYLFEDDDRLVRAVAAALAESAPLFPDIPHDPDQMLERLERSDGYLELHRFFEQLASRAWDCYLAERGGVVKDALETVQQVRVEGQMPHPPPAHEERANALEAAEDVLTERKERNRRVGEQRKKAPPSKKAKPRKPRPRSSARAAAEASGLAIQLQLDDAGYRAVPPSRETSGTSPAADAPPGRKKGRTRRTR